MLCGFLKFDKVGNDYGMFWFWVRFVLICLMMLLFVVGMIIGVVLVIGWKYWLWFFMRWNRIFLGLLGFLGLMFMEVCICGMFDFVVESCKMDCVLKFVCCCLCFCLMDGGGEGELIFFDGFCIIIWWCFYFFCDVFKDCDVLFYVMVFDWLDLLIGFEI